MNVSYAATLSAHFVLADHRRTAYRNFHGSAGALCAWLSPGQFLMMELDLQELEEVLGGMSGSREAKLRNYVEFFKKKGLFCRGDSGHLERAQRKRKSQPG